MNKNTMIIEPLATLSLLALACHVPIMAPIAAGAGVVRVYKQTASPPVKKQRQISTSRNGPKTNKRSPQIFKGHTYGEPRASGTPITLLE
jgi:hypothetical protein